jgi:hypothetical protein
MPSFPWAGRQDVSPAEDTSFEALLAGNEPPAEAGAELRPVADVLAALTARPGSDELAGLAAAQAEFRHHVAAAVPATRSRRRRPAGLASRLGVRVCAAAAVVIMGFGGAAAAAYAGALPSCWQQFAHRTIGAPAHGASHVARAATSSARSAAQPGSRPPAHQPRSGGPPARHGSRRQIRPLRHTGLSPAPPFLCLGRPPTTPAVGRWPTLHWPAPMEPIVSPDAGASNAGSLRGVS